MDEASVSKETEQVGPVASDDPVRRLYDGYLLSSRGIDPEVRRFQAGELLGTMDVLVSRNVSLRAIGSAFARHIAEDLEFTVDGFDGSRGRVPGLKEMAAQSPEEAWRLDLAKRLADGVADHAETCPEDDDLLAFFDLADPDTGWLLKLRRPGCEARLAALLDEIGWMTASDPASATARDLASAFALKLRIPAMTETPTAEPEPNASATIDGRTGQWRIEDGTVRNLRALVDRHGSGQLGHLGWAVALMIDMAVTHSGAKIGGDAVGTLKIEDIEIPIAGGDWARSFRRLLPEHGEDALKAVAHCTMRVLSGVVDLDENFPFGANAPSRAQTFKMARMVGAGVAVPTIQQRISARDAWAYINENNEAYLAAVRDVGVNWSLTQAAQTLGVGRNKLSKWLAAQGYVDAYGRPAGEGMRVAIVVAGHYGEQVRWNSKFVESLKDRAAEIDPGAKPAPVAPELRIEPKPALPTMRIQPARRAELAGKPMSDAQRVTLEVARNRYDPTDPLANAGAKADYLVRRGQRSAKQFDICVENGWLDANLQITSLGRWRLGIELEEISAKAPLPPDAVLPNPAGLPDLQLEAGQTPYRVEESAGRPPGPKIIKKLSPVQERALMASWLHGDPNRSLAPGAPPPTWSGTVYALTSRKWMTDEGAITDLGRWMLALSLKTIPRTTPAPVPVDHLGAAV